MSFRDRRQADKARSPHYAGGRLLVRALRDWIEAWLPDDELDAVTFGAGLIFGDALFKEPQGDIEPSEGNGDDVPF